jgi:hypothetical protein
MENKPNFSSGNPENDSEHRTSKGKREKDAKGSRKFVAPIPVERSEKAEVQPEQERSFQTPPSFIEKILGTDGKKAESSQKPEKLEVVGSTIEPSGEAKESDTVKTPVEFAGTLDIQHERSVADDLASEQQPSVDEVSQIPPEHDERVIEQALEIAAGAEELPSEQVEKSPVIPEVRETEPERAEEKEPEAPIKTTAAVRMATPIPLRPRRSYSGRPTGLGTTQFGSTLPPGGYNPNYNPDTTTTATDRNKAEDIEWQGRQHGRREGLFAGLLVGGGIEHFRHKRREKKMEKQQQKEAHVQQKRVELLEHDFAVAKQAQQSERDRFESTIANERVTSTVERATQEKNREKELAELKKTNERIAQQSAEVMLPEEEKQLSVPKDHHIEQSVWHNIEVDKHGRAVQESTIDYGHEYYKERAHEIGPQQQVDAAAGEVALVAAARSDEAEKQTLATKLTSSALATKKTQTTSNSISSGVQKAFKVVTTPPSTALATMFWLVTLIVIAVIILVFIR